MRELPLLGGDESGVLSGGELKTNQEVSERGAWTRVPEKDKTAEGDSGGSGELQAALQSEGEGSRPIGGHEASSQGKQGLQLVWRIPVTSGESSGEHDGREPGEVRVSTEDAGEGTKRALSFLVAGEVSLRPQSQAMSGYKNNNNIISIMAMMRAVVCFLSRLDLLQL